MDPAVDPAVDLEGEPKLEAEGGIEVDAGTDVDIVPPSCACAVTVESVRTSSNTKP
jgi:hypothetical protein